MGFSCSCCEVEMFRDLRLLDFADGMRRSVARVKRHYKPTATSRDVPATPLLIFNSVEPNRTRLFRFTLTVLPDTELKGCDLERRYKPFHPRSSVPLLVQGFLMDLLGPTLSTVLDDPSLSPAGRS